MDASGAAQSFASLLRPGGKAVIHARAASKMISGNFMRVCIAQLCESEPGAFLLSLWERTEVRVRSIATGSYTQLEWQHPLAIARGSVFSCLLPSASCVPGLTPRALCCRSLRELWSAPA